MNLVFKPQGRINQKYLDNNVPMYKEQGLAGHTGLDWSNGWGKPVRCQNRGIVYKVIKPGDLPSNWSAVYILSTDTTNGMHMEICYGHLSKAAVVVGQQVVAGQLIGYEGNYGDVFQGGVRITPDMQRSGDKRGSHVHESWRPIVKRKKTDKDSHYIRTADGKPYYNGGYCEIIFNNSKTKGFIDPMAFGDEGKKEALMKTLITALIALLEKQSK